MGKKNFRFDDYEDEDLVLDKKTKRRMERAAREREEQQRREEERMARENPEEAARNDLMNKIALLCQENRWREAFLLGKNAVKEALEQGNVDAAMPLNAVLAKIDMSMRRQMAAGLLSLSKEMLKKEYLLDVGE